jgi:hypothetical protein
MRAWLGFLVVGLLVAFSDGGQQRDRLHRLRGLGCQDGQGYCFAKPLDDPQLALHRAPRPLVRQATEPATA